MRSRRMQLRVGLLIGACMLAASCQGSGVTVQSVGPTEADPSPSPTSATATTTASVATTTPVELSATVPSSGSSDSDPEQADRAAAEAQWIKSWEVYLSIATTPIDQREALAATVTVDPAKTRMLSDAAEFDRQGLQTYGEIVHRISWPQSIMGSDTALVDDCQDASQTGSFETATGKKVTVGVSREHYQGSMTRGEDGVWRVADSFYLQDEPC